MAEPSFQWKRFWCPRGGNLNLADGGFLLDPESAQGPSFNPDVVSFERLAEIPCLVLLGEPGLGKTTVLTQERAAKGNVAGEETLAKNLNAYQSDALLVRSIFEDPSFTAWKAGTGTLNLFLDSFDECLLRIDALAAILVDRLQDCPIERLRLRIASRTAVWPAVLEEVLVRLWGSDRVGICELTPLRRKDVAEAAAANGINAEEFLRDIEHREAASLAMKPITLLFLLNLYRNGGGMPSTQEELYQQGCERLCEEMNAARRAAQRTGSLDARQRLVVAARIAAALIFCKKSAIWTGADDGTIPEEDLKIIDIVGGIETASMRSFEVTESFIRESLDTGLFSARGPTRMAFAHQTYGEYLAALYLRTRKMPLAQIESLVLHPEDRFRVIPQLQEVAAWLAGALSAIYDPILISDPQVLLGSDVTTMTPGVREKLVERLLLLFDAGKLIDSQWDLRRRYRKLEHPNLAEQLRPYIADSRKHSIVRRVAIDIAEACELTALQNLLVEIVLDPSEHIPTRVQAAYAVMRIADESTKLRMKPCITGEVGPDPQDELKGCTLHALWPTHLSAREAFTALTEPKDSQLLGSYKLFLWQQLIEHLAPADLPTALAWVADHANADDPESPFKRVVEMILGLAWDNFDIADVPKAFASACYPRICNYLPVPGAATVPEDLEHQRKRRQLVGDLLPMFVQFETDPITLLFSNTPLVNRKDVPWMVEQMLSSPEAQQKAYGKLIAQLFNGEDQEHLEAILVGRASSITLAGIIAPHIDAIDIASPLAKEQRTLYAQWQEHQSQMEALKRPKPLLDPPPLERVRRCLDQFENGTHDAWPHLNQEMTLAVNSTHYGNGLESDLSALPVWETADSAIRARIVAAGRDYLVRYQPTPQQWLGTNTFHIRDAAGYRALYLLARVDAAILDSLPSSIVKSWTAVVVGFPSPLGFQTDQVRVDLLHRSYATAPDEFIAALITLIDKENREQDSLIVHTLAEGCCDSRMICALLSKAKDTALKPAFVQQLLIFLMRRDQSNNVEEYASSLVLRRVQPDGPERKSAVAASTALLCAAPRAGWAVVFHAMQEDVVFGREVILEVAQQEDQEHVAQLTHYLSEEQISELYEWITKQFPPTEDPKHQGMHFVSPRDSVGHFRDAILQRLQARGTPGACQALERLAAGFPEIPWLRWAVLEARTIMLRHTWMPPTPSQLFQMCQDAETRFVISGDQLLAIAVESLQRLEHELQGESPGAPDLWNEHARRIYKPKDENHFSNYVTRHLRRDLKERGIIVNREVEIRRGEGDAKGERTDIHVDASVPGKRGDVLDVVSVIIEAKGCWNPKLLSDMEHQLRDRYLKDNACRHGLYLVGWFVCQQWNDVEDRRLKKVPAGAKEDLEHTLRRQAQQLSIGGVTLSTVVLNAALR